VAIERTHPSDTEPRTRVPPPATAGRRVASDASGVVQQVDDRALLELAEAHGVTIRMVRAVGEFVPEGAALLEVHGADLPDEASLRAAVHLGKERVLDDDPGFGLRQLVDIAERALSPGINDPTTAVQVIDQLHDLLRLLAARPLPERQTLGEDGRLAVHVPQPTFEDHLHLAVDEIAHWGADSPRVQRRLRAMLVDVQEAALPENRDAVARVLRSLDPGSPLAADAPSPLPTDDHLR